jgi:signal transduction histidine kinase
MHRDELVNILSDMRIRVILLFFMNIKDRIFSILGSTEEVVSPPKMLAMVLASVFGDGESFDENKPSKTFDPNITLRMLRVADLSSIAAPASFGHGNSDYSAAKSLVLSLSIYNQLVDRGFAQDRHFKMKWQRFLEVANASQYIASLYEPSLVEKAYIAGLMHDFGRICLHRYFPEEAALAQSMISDGTDILSAEKAVFGTDHQEIGQLVSIKWGMPPKLTEVISNHHPNQESIVHLPLLTRIIILADNLLFIKHLNLETLRGDQSRLNLVKACADSLGIEITQLDRIYSVLPKHFLYASDSSADKSGVWRSLAKMNDELFSLYDELGHMVKERQELSRRMLQESRDEGTLESLKMAFSTLSHYINNSIMSISGKGEFLQMLYDKNDKDGVFERIPDMTRTIMKTVRKISIILEELSSIMDLDKARHFKDSKAIDIDSALKARLDSLIVSE